MENWKITRYGRACKGREETVFRLTCAKFSTSHQPNFSLPIAACGEGNIEEKGISLLKLTPHTEQTQLSKVNSDYRMVDPPSHTMHWPVVKLDSSLAKKTTKFAMSIGRPIRPIGIVFMIC